MGRKEAFLASNVDGPSFVPSSAPIDFNNVKPVVIWGIIDAEGKLQNTVGVDGNLTALPEPDTLTTYFNATLGASATIDSDEIDMTDWDAMYLSVDPTTARNISIVVLDNEPASPTTLYMMNIEAASTDQVLDETVASFALKSYILFFLGGSKIVVRLVNNDAATAGVTTIVARRFNRRHT